MNTIKSFLEKNKDHRVHIAVVGDIGIDEYYSVVANRVSPEFPIPVLLSGDHTPHVTAPAMAGNVGTQAKHFNVDVGLFSFVDRYCDKVLNDSGIGSAGCVWLPEDCHSPIKRRFYDGNFPLSRWDIEKPKYGCDNTSLKSLQNELFNSFLKRQMADVVILSDYDKGVFSLNGKKRWARMEVPTIVDPKNGPLEDWEGCYIFKPNMKEAQELSGCGEWKDQCKYFHHILACKAVVITRGGKGVVGSIDGKYFEYIPDKKVNKESEIGAGDCCCIFLKIVAFF